MKLDLSHIHLDGRTVTIAVRHGRIASIGPADGPARRVILPLTVDPHVHLDKTFTAARCPKGRPGLFGAIETMAADIANWSEGDLRARMTRALDEAHANGMAALRSHIDWPVPSVPRAWDVMGELAQEWRGRIAVQRSSLTSLDKIGDPDIGDAIAARVARDGEVLGCFVYRDDRLRERLDHVFSHAVKYGLRLDFHVDEGLEVEAAAFDDIAALTRTHGLGGRVLCGHACSLSIRPEADVRRAIDTAAEAGVALTVLPTTNQWLQDSRPGRTPRLRGLAPLHELRAAGVPVLLGADNVADPFYPHGGYDALETLRLATLAGHLTPSEWLGAITHAPARAIGFDLPEIEVGAPANFILIDGKDWDDALRAAPAGREIVRHGRSLLSGEKAA